MAKISNYLKLFTLWVFAFILTSGSLTSEQPGDQVNLDNPLQEYAYLYLPLVAKGNLTGYSLRFYGNGQNDIDRVKILIDNPARPADIGATDFTLEFWMKANASENNSGYASCDQNDGWITAHIIFDRDVYNAGDYGDYGIALANSHIVFGVNNGTTGTTICGNQNVADGDWHHIAVTRAIIGQVAIFVDGAVDASANTGVTGNISYRNGRATNWPNSDPFLVIGAEKHDAGAQYPSYSGWIDEARLSNIIRYSNPFIRPSVPFITDSNTVALYHFDEGNGSLITDSSGATGGPSQGSLYYGGSPAGPIWTNEQPY